MHAHRRRLSLLALSGLAACSGSSGSGGVVGVNNPVQSYVVEKAVCVFPAIPRLRLLIPVLLVPSLRAATGITFEPDPSPTAPPNTYDYSIPLDSNGDGTNDTTIAGKATFSADPTSGDALVGGFQASTDVTVTTNGGQGVFEGTIEQFFDANGGCFVSGGGTYTDAITNAIVAVSVAAAAPLHVKTATDEADERPNACLWSVDGQVDVEASSADGDYSARWSFLPTSNFVQVSAGTFTPSGGTLEALPDSQFEISPCPALGAIGDWAGVYQFDWYCVAGDSGDSTFTITVLDANTIEVADDELIYQARRDAHDPHVVHGTFEDTDGGGTYEEDFLWILSSDGQSFQQVSEYFYLSGPSAGNSGLCGGVGTRN